MRLDSSSPDGPCVAVSSVVAFELSTAFVSVVCAGGGGGCSGGLLGQPASRPRDAMTRTSGTNFFIESPFMANLAFMAEMAPTRVHGPRRHRHRAVQQSVRRRKRFAARPGRS